MRIRYLVFTLILTAQIQAQLYIHDPKRDAQAKAAKKQFDEATNKDSGVYAAMLANLDTVHQRNLSTAKELNNATTAAFLNRLPSRNWEQLANDLRGLQTQFQGLVEDAENRLDEIEAAITGAKAEQSAQLKRLSAELTKQKAALSAARPTLKQFEDEIDKAKFSKQSFNAGNLQPLVKSATALKELNRLFNSLGQQPPGLQLVILDLGVSLQRVELDREVAHLLHYENQIRLEETRLRDLARVVGQGKIDPQTKLFNGPGFGQLFGQILPAANHAHNAFCAPQNEPVLVTLSRLANSGNEDLAPQRKLPPLICPPASSIPEALQYTLRLRNLVDALSQISAIQGFETFLKNSADLERSYEDQRHSIRISQINARGRETLISHGLDGLSQYYSGGWKPEDTSNLFRAIQAAATAAIGARL